jgi:hypothetical protein
MVRARQKCLRYKSSLSLKDVSHVGAKRYSADLLIHGRLSKAEIISVVKKVTRDLITREYYQNDLIKQRWANTPAKVVWLFVYLALEDGKNTNWICRSCWIDENLEPHFKPVGLDGINIGDGIVIDWSIHYKELADIYKQNTLNKEDFLIKSLHLLEQTKQLVKEIDQIKISYEKNEINLDIFTAQMTKYEAQLTEVYQQSMNIGESPLECKDFASKFFCVMSDAHNIVIPFSEGGLEIWNETKRVFLMKQAIEKYQYDLIRLEYELEKVR